MYILESDKSTKKKKKEKKRKIGKSQKGHMDSGRGGERVDLNDSEAESEPKEGTESGERIHNR